MSSSPSKLAHAPTKALVFACPRFLTAMHHRMQLPDYHYSPDHRSSSEHYSIPCTMNINHHTTANEYSMAMGSQFQTTSDHLYQGVVTNRCDVAPIYATAGPYVNNDPRQPCLGLYSEVADPSRIQETHILEQPVFQQLPPRRLVYGQPFFQSCNFPESELSYQASSKTTMSQQARNRHGELYKWALEAA